MAPINLIPVARREAKRRKFHLRCAAAGCVAFVLAASGISLGWRATATESDAGVNEQLAVVAAEIDQNTKAVATAGMQLDALREQLASNRHVLAQPDWSLLLALLGNRAGDQIVLRSCELKGQEMPGPAQGAPAAPRSVAGLKLHVSGFGKTNEAVTEFILKLEATHLFSRVDLVATSRETYLGMDAYSFRIDCPLSAGK